MFFWRIDEPLDVAAEWHLLDPLYIALPNVYVLLRIDQLPAHPRDHRCVVRAVTWLRIGAGHLVFLGKLVAQTAQLAVARDTAREVKRGEGDRTGGQPSQG